MVVQAGSTPALPIIWPGSQAVWQHTFNVHMPGSTPGQATSSSAESVILLLTNKW